MDINRGAAPKRAASGDRRQLAHLALTLVGALTAALVGGLYGGRLLQTENSLWVSGKGYQAVGVTNSAFAGYALETTVFPLAFVLGGAAATQAATLRGRLGVRLATHAALAAGSVGIAVAAWNSEFGAGGNVLQCAFLGCVDASKDEDTKWKGLDAAMGAYKVAFGAMVFLAGCLWAAFNAYLFHRALLSCPAPSKGAYAALDGAERPRPCRSAERRSPAAEFVYSVLPFALLGFAVLCTCLLGTNWQVITASKIAAGVSAPVKAAEDEGSLLRTRVFKVGTHYLHAFPDVLIYYILLAFLAGLALLARQNRTVDRFLSRRFALLTYSGPPRWWWNIQAPPWSVSVGQVVVLGASGIALTFFVKYWGYTHNYHAPGTVENAGLGSAQIAARTLGQVASATMGLLVFPIAKNSILTASFGIAWEQVLYAHIFLGALFLVLSLTHMFLWWSVFATYHVYPDAEIYTPSLDNPGRSILKHDIFAIAMFYPCNAAPNKCSDTPHADNFTIPLVVIVLGTTVAMTLMFARNAVRRANFELFYYAHHVYLALFAAVLYHAESAWYYVGGGLTLWFLDRCLRTVNRTKRWETVSLEDVGAQTTRLELRPADGGVFEYACGQYYFLNVPEIARWEWHPFTVSSAPSDGRITSHIKQAPAGPDSFTGRLHRLASKSALGDDEALLHGGDAAALPVVNVDGPYGAVFETHKYSRVALVVGGIGVTPAASIFRELWLNASVGGPEVHIVWTVAALVVIDPFLDILLDAHNDDRGGGFKVSVYVDNEPLDGKADYGGLPVAAGRPDYETIVADLAASEPSGDRVPHVFACGPPGMAAAANTLCLKHDVSYHAEVFAY